MHLLLYELSDGQSTWRLPKRQPPRALIFLYFLSFCGGHMAQLEQHRPQSRDTARKKTALCMGSTGFPSQAHKTIAGTNASPVFSRTCTRLGFFPPSLADFSKCHAQCFFYCRSLFSFGVSLSRRTSFTKCQCCLHCRLTPCPGENGEIIPLQRLFAE